MKGPDGNRINRRCDSENDGVRCVRGRNHSGNHEADVTRRVVWTDLPVVDDEYARLIEEAEHAHAPRLAEMAQAAEGGTLAALAESIPTVEQQIAENE